SLTSVHFILSKFTVSLSQYSSFFTIINSLLCSHDSSVNGPLETKESASACHFGFSSATYVFTGKHTGLVITCRNNPVGASSVTSHLLSSLAATPSSSAEPSPLLQASPPSIK